jgi:hypothetical protein
MVELLINNVYIPVGDKLSVDKGVNGLGDLSSRGGDVSASFDVEATPEVLSAFNGVFNRRTYAQVYNNGTLQSTGYVLVSSRALRSKKISLDYFGEVSDLSALLGDSTLRELDWSDLNHNKTEANILASFNNTSGYVYPIMDYNYLKKRVGLSYNNNDLYPAIFLKTMLEKVLNSISYTLRGTLLNDYIFNRALIHYAPSDSDFETISDTYGQSRYSIYSPPNVGSGFLGIEYLQLGSEFTNNYTRVDNGGNFDFPNNRYIAPRDGLVKVWGYFRLDRDASLDVKKNGVLYSSLARIEGQANNFFFYVPVVAGDYIEVESYVNTSTYYFTYDVRIQMSAFDATGLVEVNNYVEDVSCEDVLKFILTYYCGIMSVDAVSRVVTINKINDIVNNIPNAYDWTDKIDRSKEVKLEFNAFNSDYGQTTIFTHKDADNDAFIQNYKKNLRGDLKLSNDTLARESDFYESPFTPVIFENIKGIDISRIDRYTFDEIMSFNAASTSDGYLRLNTSTGHGMSIGNYINISSSTRDYIGIQVVLDVIDETSVVVNTLYQGTDSGILFKMSEVKEIGSRIMIFDSVQPVTNFTTKTLYLNGNEVENIPFIYSNLDLPSYDNSGGQKRTFVTWAKAQYDVNGIKIDSTESNGLLDEYWVDAKTMLEQGEGLNAYFHLDSIDVKDFDYSIPIYIQDTSSYYYLSTIENYKFRKGIYLCKLIRLN